jgi:xanthine dehydrogenase accessory factor
VIIVTRGHKYDYQALAAAARSNAGYIGLMGSRRKVTLIYRQLIADGVPAERLRDIHAPIGLDIGAVSPEEIAVSIMAEVTMHRLGGSGGSMRDARLIEHAEPKPVA